MLPKLVTYLNFLCILFIMLSIIEKEYVKNPGEFEKTHSQSYVRKIRNHIRKKVITAIDDMIQIYDLDHTDSGHIKNDDNFEHGYCRSIHGRKRKPLIDCFGSITLHAFDGLDQHYDATLKYMKDNMKYANLKWFNDTEVGKYYNKSK